MPSSKPKKGEIRKRRAIIPDHPWPVGSLCANIVSLDIKDVIETRHNCFASSRYIKVSEQPRRDSVFQAPFIYLGIAVRELDEAHPHADNVVLAFFSVWGLVTWMPDHHYDGQVRSLAAFEKAVTQAFTCLSRFDRALG